METAFLATNRHASGKSNLTYGTIFTAYATLLIFLGVTIREKTKF